MSEEHLIPRALGGRLTVRFLCSVCNSRLGSEVEDEARRDPELVAAIDRFARDYPSESAALIDRSLVVAHGPGGSVPAMLQGGEVRVRPSQLDDGSLVQPTSAARRSIRRILEKQGVGPAPIEEALARFDSSQENTKISLAPDLEVVKWEITHTTPDVSGPEVHVLVPVKTAFEFIACHVGAAIYETDKPLADIRSSLRSGVPHESIRVERLRAVRTQPIHGILFEGNAPHAIVQIRLFGSVAFRVHFLNLSVSGPRFVYTHLLSSGEESIAEAAA
jgi:hypothetical protein